MNDLTNSSNSSSSASSLVVMAMAAAVFVAIWRERPLPQRDPDGVWRAPRYGAAPMTSKPLPSPTSTQYYPTIIDAARVLGWTVAHFRPGRTSNGWRTAVQGDGKGFPDFVLVHGGAGRVWFVELKFDGGKLTAEQTRWGETLLRAGAVYRAVYVPSQLSTFLQDLADAVRPT